MTTPYTGWRVERGDGSRLDLELTLNQEAKGAGNGQGNAAGYRIFDAGSRNLITEGPGSPGSTPGKHDAGQIELSVNLPPEPGRYRVYVSPVHATEGWAYEHGSKFLLIDAEVGNGVVQLVRSVMTTVTRQRTTRFLQGAAWALVAPVKTIRQNRSLIRSMVRRDILGRYRGSFGGLFWAVIHPVLMMLTYTFVFGVVLRTRFGDDGHPSNFVLYFLAGMLPWLPVSEAAGRAPGVVLEHANFVKKLRFPVEILPVNLTMAGLFSQLFGVVIFIGAMLYFGRDLSLTALYLPVLLIPQFLLTLGLTWLLAVLGVFFRDLGQLIGFMLTVWFFTTPICFPEESLPQNYLWLFEKNPMFVLVHAYRAVLLEGAAPAWESLAIWTALAAVFLILAHALFYKLKRSFADLV